MNRKNSGSVIIVDDDPYVLDSLSLLLKRHGYHVLAFDNAREAMAKFAESRVDAVMTDIKMPVVTGIDLLEDIHTIDPDVPVILMTAYADLDIAIEAIKKGAFDFIIKPYKPEQIVHSLGMAIKYKKLLQVEKEYKHMLEEFNQEIETIVAERTMSLMALTLADKVRNPAFIIGNVCRRILEKEAISEQLRESLGIISDETDKLQDIVRDFQILLKSKRSLFNYEDINAIVTSVIPFIEKEAADKGLELSVNLSGQPLKINTQRSLLRVAIFHVLRNAIEATPEGGRIVITTSPDGNDRVVVSISDTGHGIPEMEIEKIFDPFYSTKKQRFGMGLPLVKQIISEHMGEIKIESEVEKGTTFRMIFPTKWLEQSIK